MNEFFQLSVNFLKEDYVRAIFLIGFVIISFYALKLKVNIRHLRIESGSQKQIISIFEAFIHHKGLQNSLKKYTPLLQEVSRLEDEKIKDFLLKKIMEENFNIDAIEETLEKDQQT